MLHSHVMLQGAGLPALSEFVETARGIVVRTVPR